MKAGKEGKLEKKEKPILTFYINFKNMTQRPPKPMLTEYLQFAALDVLKDLSKMTEHPNMFGTLSEMYLQTISSESFDNATKRKKESLKSHFEAIKSTLELIELWKEYIKDVENGLNDDDVLLTFRIDRSN